MTISEVTPVLQVDDLHVAFESSGHLITAVDGVSFKVRAGQILGIVGESGSGKSVTSRAIMRMIHRPGRITRGSIRLMSREVTSLTESQMEQLRGSVVAMVFQDPQSALNPVLKIRVQIAEALRNHGADRRSATRRTIELLSKVGIPNPQKAAEKYPHEFSGGMRQRVVIAIALANNPDVLIADEPTTALDVTVQAQILRLLRDLRDELGIAILFITHDLGVVGELCDDVLVMRHGKIVESGSVGQVLTRPSHPYTVQLMEAIPKLSAPVREDAPNPALRPILELCQVRINVNTRSSFLTPPDPFFAVDGISLEIRPGETLALVGESGCGKSTLSRGIIGINRVTSGEILLEGKNATTMKSEELARSVQYVFQDPYSSLNPRRTAGQSLSEALLIAGTPRKELRDRSVELLERVHLESDHLDRYPWAFSGGQRQRIGIARALATRPKLMILDEPVSALDVSIQAQILDLLKDLQKASDLAFLFISHDLAVVKEISHSVAVMRGGKIVEQGRTAQVFDRPEASYTRELLAATPDFEKVMA